VCHNAGTHFPKHALRDAEAEDGGECVRVDADRRRQIGVADVAVERDFGGEVEAGDCFEVDEGVVLFC
jgi:hypothetical protein